MQIDSCRSCGSKRLSSILNLGKQPWCNELVSEDQDTVPTYPLHLVACLDCELLQLDFTVPKEKMFSNHGYLSGMTKTLLEHFLEVAKENKDQFGLKVGDLIVDIGGNDGSQLMQYQKLGLDNVVNVESASNIADISKGNNVPTINDFFNEDIVRYNFDEGEAKLINAAGVFFHLEELHSVIKGIKYLLAADGVFTVQCMYAGELIKGGSFDMIYHEHLCYYTLRSLSTLLSPYGLEVFDARFSPIHSGSLIVKVGHRGKRVATDQYRETLEEDSRFTLSEFRRFADKIRKNRFQLKTFLVNLKYKKNRIYAYGAPAKGNTLLNYECISNDVIDKAVEINPLKIGYRLPCSNIPIQKESKEDCPDYYLLLSHNFSDEIIKKNEDIIQKGVKFITPFLRVKVL